MSFFGSVGNVRSDLKALFVSKPARNQYFGQVGWAEKPSIFVKIHAGLFSPAYLWPVQPVALWLFFLPPIHRAAILDAARFDFDIDTFAQ